MAKLTKKQYTRKRLFAGVAIFASVVLVVTGVAVWLLFSSLSANTSGSMNVAQVATSPLSFSNLKVDDVDITEGTVIEDAFVFDSQKDDDYGRVRWNGESHEKLKINVSGIVLNAQYLESFSYTLELPKGIIEAAQKGYLDISEFYDAGTGKFKSIEVSLSESGSFRTDGTATAWYFSFDISLKWGSLFGYTNPSVYYDSQGKDIPTKQVMDILEDMHSTITGNNTLVKPRFTLTITASPNR